MSQVENNTGNDEVVKPTPKYVASVKDLTFKGFGVDKEGAIEDFDRKLNSAYTLSSMNPTPAERIRRLAEEVKVRRATKKDLENYNQPLPPPPPSSE